MEKVIIDVREKDEFLAEHIAGSINLPLSDFDTHAPSLLRYFKERQLVFMCRSGNRALLAAGSIAKLGIELNQPVEVYAGGITMFKANGFPVIQHKILYMPIMRQVHLIAGSLMVVSLILGSLFSMAWLTLGLVVGGGLMLSGATGFCGMGIILAKMPWNKISPRAMTAPCHECRATAN